MIFACADWSKYGFCYKDSLCTNTGNFRFTAHSTSTISLANTLSWVLQNVYDFFFRKTIQPIAKSELHFLEKQGGLSSLFIRERLASLGFSEIKCDKKKDTPFRMAGKT